MEHPRITVIGMSKEGADDVLIIHGSPGDASQGRVLGHFLTERHCLITYSRPGYGDRPLEGCESIDQQADLAAETIETMLSGPVPVLAWSGGAPSAYRLAALHPDKVSKLVVCSGVSGPYQMHSESLADRWMLSSERGNKLIEQMLQHTPKQAITSTLKEEGELTRQQLKEQVEAVLASPQQTQFMKDLTETVFYTPERRAGLANDKEQFAKIEDLQLEQIEAQMLLIHGKADTDVPYEHGVSAAERLPNSELITVNDGTHLCTWAHPRAEELQQRIIDFLAE